MNDEELARCIIGQASVLEQAEVLAWRKRSPANESRYLALADLLALASAAHEDRVSGPAPTASQIVALSNADTSDRAPISEDSTTTSRPRRRIRTVGILAAAAILVLSLITARAIELFDASERFGVQQFVTGPSEQATVVLTDGTVVRLASDRRLSIPDSTAGRSVLLVGRAYFAVTHDEAHPFTVRTGSGEVRVLGTRFALDTGAEDLRLVVIEGQVALAGSNDERETLVRKNEMARVVRGSTLPVIEVADPIVLADWVGNFLAFQDTPLRDAVREIEREYDVTIDLVDQQLGDRTITAWFAGWTLADVMDVVCIVANATCEVGDSQVTMRAAKAVPP